MLLMTVIRVLVFSAALAVALSPIAVFAQDRPPDLLQAELANGEAQLALAEQEAQDLDNLAEQSAANERMIALLQSEAMRLRQLSLVANATAMEQIAASLANAARMEGEI